MYAMISAGLIAYVETGNVRYLAVAAALYFVGHVAMRLNAQIQESKRLVEQAKPPVIQTLGYGVEIEDADIAEL
jgi:hypothetical protein